MLNDSETSPPTLTFKSTYVGIRHKCGGIIVRTRLYVERHYPIKCVWFVCSCKWKFHINLFNNNNDFPCVNILEDQAQWQSDTHNGYSMLIYLTM